MNGEKLQILRHALGLARDGSGKSTRNYYAAPFGGPTLKNCETLARDGYLANYGNNNFYVTDLGQEEAKIPPSKDSRVTWVEKYLDLSLSEFQRKAVSLLCDAMRCGPYDIRRGKTFEKVDWHYGHGVRFVVYRPQLATYDTDGLTALVLGAHDLAIRVEIDPVNFTHLAITMHPRQRQADSQFAHHHPSIEQVLARRAKAS